MNTKTQEALKMAIETMKIWNGKNVKTNTASFRINFEEAIQACKEGLEQEPDALEAIQDAIDFLDGSYETHKVRKALQEALAQPAQSEYVVNSGGTGTELRQPAQKPVACDGKFPENFAPSWQGLTAKEIASIPLNEYTVQTVERMLKEKNHA